MSEVDLLHAHLRGEHVSERAEGCRACGGLPPVSTEVQRPVRQDPPAPGNGRRCGCGCGKPVKRRFLPGHDAKLKSRLLKEARGGSEAAKRNLEENGWSHFL